MYKYRLRSEIEDLSGNYYSLELIGLYLEKYGKDKWVSKHIEKYIGELEKTVQEND